MFVPLIKAAPPVALFSVDSPKSPMGVTTISPELYRMELFLNTNYSFEHLHFKLLSMIWKNMLK